MGEQMRKQVITSPAVIVCLVVASIFTAPIAHGVEKNPYGTNTVDPASPNEIIFSISKNSRKADFTLSRILKMKSSEISIYEPFLKKRQRFTVIPMKNFFTLAGISGKDKVRTIALNDYVYSNSAEKFLSAQAYIAIKRDGLPIPYDQGGPIRIVFGDKSKWAKELDAWNWSLASIRVE